MTRARVAVIGTGGTISSVGRDPLDVWEYMDHSTKLEADELVAGVPELAAVADVVPVRHQAVSSAAIAAKDWLALNTLVHEVVARERVAGVVITHGTATLEETAYFLNLVATVDVPVVVVGSQRPFSGLSTDARMNLVGAGGKGESVTCGYRIGAILRSKYRRPALSGSAFRRRYALRPSIRSIRK